MSATSTAPVSNGGWDYTGCGIGIDWRTKMPPVGDKGYVLMSPPTACCAYLNLEDAYQADWRSWKPPDFGDSIGDTEIGVQFDVGSKPVSPGAKGNILALLTRISHQVPAASP